MLDPAQHAAHDLFGVVPQRIGTDALVRSRREPDSNLIEAEILEHGQDEIVDLEDFVGKLLFGAEDMRVVLGEAAHAHQPEQRAGGLIAVHGAEFGEPNREVSIGFQAMLENLHMARAIHRLQRENTVVRFGLLVGDLRP